MYVLEMYLKNYGEPWHFEGYFCHEDPDGKVMVTLAESLATHYENKTKADRIARELAEKYFYLKIKVVEYESI